MTDGADEERRQKYFEGLREQTNAVFAENEGLTNHLARPDLAPDLTWALGSIGDPFAGIWFVAQGVGAPTLAQALKNAGGVGSPELQWWLSKGDHLFREALQEAGFRRGGHDDPDAWNCYVTNLVKYARPPKGKRQLEIATQLDVGTWAPVLRWQLQQSAPKMIVMMGDMVEKMLLRLKNTNRVTLDGIRLEKIQSYAYLGKPKPDPEQWPRQYKTSVKEIAKAFRELTEEEI